MREIQDIDTDRQAGRQAGRQGKSDQHNMALVWGRVSRESERDTRHRHR